MGAAVYPTDFFGLSLSSEREAVETRGILFLKRVMRMCEMWGVCAGGHQVVSLESHSKTVFPSLDGARDWFHGRQFFPQIGEWGMVPGWFKCITSIALDFCYYTVIHNELIMQLTKMQSQWKPWVCFPARSWSHLGVMRAWWGVAVNTDESSLVCWSLTSCCMPGFLMGHGPITVSGSGAGDLSFIILQCISCSWQTVPSRCPLGSCTMFRLWLCSLPFQWLNPGDVPELNPSCPVWGSFDVFALRCLISPARTFSELLCNLGLFLPTSHCFPLCFQVSEQQYRLKALPALSCFLPYWTCTDISLRCQLMSNHIVTSSLQMLRVIH